MNGRAGARMVIRRLGLAMVLAMAATHPAAAQGSGQEEDPFGGAYFAPDLVMMHARAIGLTTEQRSAITEAIQDLQGQAVALQLQMVEAVQAAVELSSQPRVDEARVIEATGHVLDLEHQVKLTQMRMLIRIKNALTPQQQQRLHELRDRRDDGYSTLRVFRQR